MVRREAAVLTRAAILLAALAVILLAVPLVPEPATATGFRMRAYGTQAVWFVLVSLAALAIVRAVSQLTMRRLLLALAASLTLVMALNLAGWLLVADLAKVVFGSLAGAAFVRTIERPWWLIPIAVCVPLADAWSVFSERGVTKAIVDWAREEPAWIDWPTIATPIAGYPYEQFGRLGIVDILFLSLFLGVATRWRLGTWRGIGACSAGLLATSILVFEGTPIAVPALPLLCIAFLVAYAPALWRDARAAWQTR